MDDERLYFVASDITISDEKTNDIFLEIDMRLLSTRQNKNSEGVTEAFIDEICSNEETYACLPLYADVPNLKARNFDKLGHKLNRLSGKFGTAQIGSIHHFRKVEDEYGVSLLGTARVPKRESEICESVMELYELGELSFSFEIKYVMADTVLIDGVRYVDASDRNVLFGMTIVTTPAYDESVALNLVAEENTEILSDSAETDEGVETMNEVVNEVATEPIVEVAEETPAEIVAEEVVAEAPVVEDSSEDTVVEVAEETPAEESPVEETIAEETEPAAEPAENAVAEEHEDEPEGEEEQTAQAALDSMPHPIDCDCPACQQDAAIDAAHAQLDAEAAKLYAQIAQLQAELEILRAEHAELEAYRAAQRAQELQAKQSTVRVFAEAQGLDVEDAEVAKAIAELDYEKLVTLSVASSQAEQAPSAQAEDTVTASFVGSESMSLDGKYARVLARNN